MACCLAVLALLATGLYSFAQTPIITPKSNIVLKLDNTGNRTISPSDIADIRNPDGSTPTSIVISPAQLNCSNLGPQTIKVTAANSGASTPENARFTAPQGLAFDPAGNLYVADAQNLCIRKISATGIVTTFAGLGQGQGSTTFNYPTGITTDAAGNVFFTDSYNGVVRKITPAGNVSIYARVGHFLIDLVFDSKGNLFVLDNEWSLIYKITPDGQITTMAGKMGVRAYTDGIGTAATFFGMNGVSIDKQDNLIIADQHTVRMMTPAGVVTTIAGNKILEGNVDGVGELAKFNLPEDVVLDAAGNIYVADYNNNLIRKINPLGVVTTFAGNGKPGAVNGIGTAASFNGPLGLTIDPDGNIYVAEYTNNDIRKITPAGVVTTLAGNGTRGVANGNIGGQLAGSASMDINVMVVSTPVFAPHADVIIAADDNCQAVVPNYTNITATSCASVILPVVQSPAAGTPMLPNNAVTVTLTATDVYGNMGSINFNVTAKSKPLIAPVTQPITLTLDATGHYTLKQSDLPLISLCDGRTPTVSFSPASFDCSKIGRQTVTITAGNPGTTDNAVTTIRQIVVNIVGPLPPSVIVMPSATTVCAGTPVTFKARPENISGTPVYQWLLNGGQIGTNNTEFTLETPKNGDVVSCSITGLAACFPTVSSAPVTITVNPLPSVAFGSTLSIQKGASVVLQPIISGDIATYQWLPAAGLSNSSVANPTASPNATTTYQLTVTTVAGCQATASIIVFTGMDVPSAFTPNGDGINDQWKIGWLSAYPNNTVDIFDRNGQALFHSNGYSKPWDGTQNGNTLPAGVYYYLIDPKNSTLKPQSGWVTIIR